MPRTYKQNKEIKDQRKGQILSKSVELFAKLGFEQVTMDDIAKATKCSRTLLYHYFRSKDDLLLAHKKICEDIFVSKLKEYMDVFEPGEEFLKASNDFFLKMIYEGNVDSVTTCIYLQMVTLLYTKRKSNQKVEIKLYLNSLKSRLMFMLQLDHT